ncbi:beta-galactosidase [Paenibacillus sp. FSL R10-2734]|uniref:beta-galactosidase n=1 Tax=Paenibacillus sp. FSL R10-2734 TaxID=2954691 RepID=UPI0030DB0457
MNEHWMKKATDCIGCQIWIEPDETRERVEALFQEAQKSGIGWVRIFLMWPWIEEVPGMWNFDLFDYVFDAANKYGLRIKATLTANSGPWHIGTPSLLHSHTGFLSPEQRVPMRNYIVQCISRYKDHPALGQWIVWNEPTSGNDRTEEALQHWQAWLSLYYNRDIHKLNKRWRTGYSSFNDVPFPEDILHPDHKNQAWNSYGPWLLDWQSRASWLQSELQWICDVIRELDKKTETCMNPIPLMDNQAAGGIQLDKMAQIVDVVGASYHPAWNFTFANRAHFPALMSIGVRKQAATLHVQRVEVTEVQTGNTLVSSNRPCEASAGEIARYFLANLAAGAETVTGWLLNTRSCDFEAGDWGLLDDIDQQSPRSEMLCKVRDRLAYSFSHTGAWQGSQPRAWVGYSAYSQAIEWTESLFMPKVPGRSSNDNAHGSALLTAQLMECGVDTIMSRIEDLPLEGKEGGLIVLSHVVALEQEQADRLLDFVQTGGTLIFDATTGRKDHDARLQRPWPGGLSEQIGMRAMDLHTIPSGYKVLFEGQVELGTWIAVRNRPLFVEGMGWKPWRELRFEMDDEPCIWDRPYGLGKIIFVNGLLGPSLIYNQESSNIAKYIFNRAATSIIHNIRPIPNEYPTYIIPVQVENGELTAIFSSDLLERKGKLIRLQAESGTYLDLWTGEEIEVNGFGEVALPAHEGVVLLWKK